MVSVGLESGQIQGELIRIVFYPLFLSLDFHWFYKRFIPMQECKQLTDMFQVRGDPEAIWAERLDSHRDTSPCRQREDRSLHTWIGCVASPSHQPVEIWSQRHQISYKISCPFPYPEEDFDSTIDWEQIQCPISCAISRGPRDATRCESEEVDPRNKQKSRIWHCQDQVEQTQQAE